MLEFCGKYNIIAIRKNKHVTVKVSQLLIKCDNLTVQPKTFFLALELTIITEVVIEMYLSEEVIYNASVSTGNAAKATEILADIDKGVPGIIMVKLRRINLERRRQNFDAVAALYEEAMIETSDQELATFFAVRYSRFLSKVHCDTTFLRTALEIKKKNPVASSQILVANATVLVTISSPVEAQVS